METLNKNFILPILKNFDYNILVKFKSSKNSHLLRGYLECPKYFPLENVVSRYNSNLYCTIIAYEFYENEFRVHIAVRGDMSMGSLQHPSYSIITISKNKIIHTKGAKYTVQDSARAYDGYLIFDYNELEKGDIYFTYGQFGYSKVKLFTY